jgi:predicted chitinase
MPLSRQQLIAAMPRLKTQPALASLYHPHLVAAMREFGITTLRRAQMFLAQLAHESGQLRYMEEIASGAAYEGRRDLGNTQPGDGRRFKGRGPIQLTGRANYRTYGKLLGIDLERHPERAADPDVGFRIAALYWKRAGCNALADKGTLAAFKAVTKKINGGYNGLDDRIRHWERAKKAIARLDDTAATGPSAALRPLAAEAGADSGSSPLESAPVPVVDAVPVVEVAAVAAAPEPVPGGGPDDPTVRVTAKKSTIAGEMVAGITGIATLASGHIQTLTGMPPDVQKIVVIIAAALLALWFIGGLISRWQTREIHANAGKRNVV